MSKCKECGKRIDGDSRFCKHCGYQIAEPDNALPPAAYAYCAHCGAKMPENASYCLICGTKSGQAPPRPVQQQAVADIKIFDTSISSTSEMELSEIAVGVSDESDIDSYTPGSTAAASVAADRGRMSRAAIMIALLLIIGVAAIGVWKLLPYVVPGDLPPIGEGVLYVKDGGKLMLSFPDETPLEISGSYNTPGAAADDVQAVSSPDGRYIAYANAAKRGSDGYLYLLDLSRLGRTDLQPPEGDILFEGTVRGFSFSQKGNYLIYLSSKGELYGYDYKKNWLIDTDVRDIVEVGDRQVLYTKTGASGAGSARYDIYLRSIAMEIDDKVIIAQNASELLDWTKNYTSFIYLQQKAGGASDVLRYDAKLYQSQTLVQSADVVIDVSAERGTVIFARKKNYVPSYDQLVDDPFLEADKRMREPLPERFGLPEDYEDIFAEETDKPYDVQEQIERQDMYYEEYQEFTKALSLYDEVLERNQLRADAAAFFLTQRFPGIQGYEISVYRDNVAQVIEDGVYLLETDDNLEALQDIFKADIEKDYAVYIKSDPFRVPSLDLSLFGAASGIDIIGYVTKNIPRQLCFSRLGQNPSIVHDMTGTGNISGFEVTDKVDGLYFITGKDKTLEYCAFKNDMFSEPLEIDKDVSFIAESVKSFNGSMLYIKNADGNTCDLYSIKEAQNPVPVANDISIAPVFTSENSGKSLMYYRGYDLSGNVRGQIRGELYLLVKQERLIVGDVYKYDYRGDKLIYLVRDWDASGKGELYLYREGGVTPVDTGVVGLISLFE